MNVRLLAFTEQGFALAKDLACGLDGEAARCGENCSLSHWTAAHFPTADALIYVGAAGIAVRAIAPHIKSKAADPAVVVVDETARWVIPVLSGHLGGANALANRIAALCGATPVITTATDLHARFAVDLWAKRQNCAVLEPGRIKDISARLLAGDTVEYESDWPIAGDPPQGVAPGQGPGFHLTLHPQNDGRLHLLPRIAVLGVGCKKNTSPEALEQAFVNLLKKQNLWEESFYQVCSIDLKQDEPGLLDFCAAHGWTLQPFSARDLANLPGDFTASGFVKLTTGVDNVCERAAVLGSGGTLLSKKQAAGGVTLAVALAPFFPDWRWQDG